jgi:hypothetical protein
MLRGDLVFDRKKVIAASVGDKMHRGRFAGTFRDGCRPVG